MACHHAETYRKPITIFTLNVYKDLLLIGQHCFGKNC